MYSRLQSPYLHFMRRNCRAILGLLRDKVTYLYRLSAPIEGLLTGVYPYVYSIADNIAARIASNAVPVTGDVYPRTHWDDVRVNGDCARPGNAAGSRLTVFTVRGGNDR